MGNYYSMERWDRGKRNIKARFLKQTGPTIREKPVGMLNDRLDDGYHMDRGCSCHLSQRSEGRKDREGNDRDSVTTHCKPWMTVSRKTGTHKPTYAHTATHTQPQDTYS